MSFTARDVFSGCAVYNESARHVSPHDANLVERMRDGSKPICELAAYRHQEMIELMTMVSDGRLGHLTVPPCVTSDASYHIFYQNGQEAGAHEVVQLMDSFRRGSTDCIAAEQRLGELFGYSELEIEAYIKLAYHMHEARSVLLLESRSAKEVTQSFSI